MKQKFVFYYREFKNSPKIKVATKECIKPTYTKIWKELKASAYDVIGVCLEEAFDKF